VELKLPVVTERRGFVIYRMNETKEAGRMKVGDDFEGNK
jgi:acetolactate synthase regulatory subunit